LLACDVGITSCDWAIAETGTLMMCAGPGHERVASLLPPMHVAVVERQQIVPDLIDAFATLNATTLPSNVTLITGPSKTGDIELQLTTGVHGPGKWRVIVVRASEGGH
jgi:L-lactate dehydrogenase complex protein LldG